MSNRVVLPIILAATALGCAKRGPGPIKAERVSLAQFASQSDPAVGTTVNNGRELVLLRSGALHIRDANGFSLLWSPESTTERFTAVTTLDNDRLALTASSGVQILELETMTTEMQFPYQGESGTASVPRSLSFGDGRVLAAIGPESTSWAGHLQTYDAQTGEPGDLHSLPVSQAPNGIARWYYDEEADEEILVGGLNDTIFLLASSPRGVTLRESIGRLGIDEPVDVRAMAFDEVSGKLHFIDGASNELRALPLEEVVDVARERRREEEEAAAEWEPLGS